MTGSEGQSMQFSAEISKILQLMIHSLYTNKDIFLRELISNASDANDKLRYLALTQPELLKGDQQLKITLSANKDARTLTIADNGIGMNREELIAHLGTIAKSGTQEFFSALTGDTKKDVTLIGQFGVGFYSSFIVADKVTVESRKAGEDKGYVWESKGKGEFSVRELDKEIPRGTRITLHIREGEDVYLDKFRIRHIAQTYSDHIEFPIEFIDEEGKTETINAGSALWSRPKSEVTLQQYQEFYHHVAHSPDEPWMILHNKVEGTMSYTNLLFIPSIRPFDLFHPDRKRRVKLYVKRVFITEEGINLIPHYLRFMRGIIDSEDLPLNISRETLQQNPVLDKIRESIAKKVLSELKKKAESEPESYIKFWGNFGSVIKEGLCEAHSPKELILEASRFYSTHGEGLTSLDDYISRMKPGQEHVFYLTGERLENLRKHPQLEGFTKRGIEVLLFADHVDDFWVNVVHKYKDKPLLSVTRSTVDLDKIATLPAEEKAEEQKEKPQEKDISTLIAFLKTTYGEEVKDVRTTAKLANSPVCLAVGEGDMDIRMERFLVENKQLPSRSAKILEINPHHPIIQTLMARVAQKGTSDEAADMAWLLLDQARILEGDEVGDPAAFTWRMNSYLQKALAA